MAASNTPIHCARGEHKEVQEEEPVLSLYFAAEDSLLAADSDMDTDSDSERGDTSTSNTSSITCSSSSTPKSTTYETTKIPSPTSIIALISQRRLDRLTPEQAQRAQTDTCLPCAASFSAPGEQLHTLPCAHRWCTACLARAFLFAQKNHTHNRLQCCDPDADIPLAYFENIAQDRQRPPPEWERQDVHSPTTGGGDEERIPGLRDWNPINVVPLVEKDPSDAEGVYITTGDVASYKEALLEFKTLPKDRIYCPRSKSCGSFIPPPPKGSRKGNKVTTVTCPKCSHKVCLRCRKNPSSHTNGAKSTKCTAGKPRMEIVKNDRKLLSLARRKGWKRCPRCRMFVEKVKGNCSSVVCACGQYFFHG